jgi:colicin import membrane protein
MIRILSKSPDAASPRMLMISAGLHAIFLCAIILVSYSMTTRNVPNKEISHRVTLQPSAPTPVPERMRSDPTNVAALPREELEPQTNAKQLPASARQTIEAAALSPVQDQAIPLRKRKPAKPVEKPKKPESKKSAETPAKKQEDPKAYLDKKLASIREKVENRKSDASPRLAAPTVSQSPGNQESGDSGAQEMLRLWLEGVRNRINSRWSVFGDHRQVRGPTEISVQINDDGRLVDAAVNRSSGNQVFDQSALRAIFQADPFPPISPEVREQIHKAGGLALRFAPGGMQ